MTGTPSHEPASESINDRHAALLIASVAVVVAFTYVTRIDPEALPLRETLHRQIVDGSALSPYRYRVLVPFLAEGLIRTLNVFMPWELAFRLAYAFIDLVGASFVLLTLYRWLREWYSSNLSLIGVLFVAGTVPIALQDHYFQPWSLPECAFFTSALIATRGGYHRLLAAILVLATLNRETAVLILMASAAIDSADRGMAAALRRPSLLRLVGLWAAILVGLRLYRGSAPPAVSVEALLALNLSPENLGYAFVNVSLLFGALWVFALLGLRSAPPALRRLALVVPPYVAAIAIWGIWFEVRLLMPLYPVVVPLGLSFLQHAGVHRSTVASKPLSTR